jgi:hypothetical protein
MWKSDNNEFLDTLYRIEVYTQKREEAVKAKWGSKAQFIVHSVELSVDTRQCKIGYHVITENGTKSTRRRGRLTDPVHHVLTARF